MRKVEERKEGGVSRSGAGKARCFDFDSKSIFYPWQQKIPDSNIFCNTSKLGA